MSFFSTQRQLFTSGAIRRFLEENDRLKTLTFSYLPFDAGASNAIGRYSRGLVSIRITCRECDTFDAQQFANGIQENLSGPTSIILLGYDHEQDSENSEVSLTSIIVPLLRNPRLRVLRIQYLGFIPSGNLEVAKAALQASQSLEALVITGEVSIGHARDLEITFRRCCRGAKSTHSFSPTQRG
jgi:hypothetical protein